MALLASMGCERGLLDKISYSALPGEYVLETQEGLEKLLTGCYNQVQSNSYYGGRLYLYEAAKGPDFFQRNVGGGYSFKYENRHGEYTRFNGNAWSLWKAIYSVVRNTTILLDSIDDVTGDVGTLRRIKGEAYALRGLAYFDLLRLFTNPPKYSCSWGSSYRAPDIDPSTYDPTLNTKDPVAGSLYCWGVPLIKTAAMGFDILDHHAARATADECYQYVKEQFEMAHELLKGTVPELGHVNEAAVLALRIRLALYTEQYSDVIILGKEFMDIYEPNYSMLQYDNYRTSYYKPHNSESIWELVYTADDNLGSNAINYWVRKRTFDTPNLPEQDGKVDGNIGYAKMGLSYGDPRMGYEHLNVYPSDIRKYLICDLGVPGKDYKTIRKYVGSPYHYVHNVPVVRLPEVYLSISEAACKLGYDVMAQEYLAKVTSVRRLDDAPAINSYTDILDERRREFILEGHTYWDYARNGRTIEGRQIIECITSNSNLGFPSTTRIYPIPLAEMNANPAIRNQQNPGYGAWYLATDDNEE